jgi:hypothetical protein
MIKYDTHMSMKINRLEEGHNSYPLVCRRPAETVSLPCGVGVAIVHAK